MNRKISKIVTISFMMFVIFALINSLYQREIISSDEQIYDDHEIAIPKISAISGILNITNYQINGSRFYHNDVVQVEGKLFKPIPPPPPYTNMSNYNVSLVLDGNQMPQFNDTTDINGNFRIIFSVPYNWNIYSVHIVKVEVTDDIGGDLIEQLNQLVFFSNATSYFDIDSYNQNFPILAGTNYPVPGYLRLDNGTILSSESITYNWYNKSESWPSGVFNTAIDGSFPQNLVTPNDDNSSGVIYLNLTYSGINNYVNGSKKIIPVNIYRNITCNWSAPVSADVGNRITVGGELYSRDNPNLKINFTEVKVRFSGTEIGTVMTDAKGLFNLSYNVPGGSQGFNIIEVELSSYSSVSSNTTHIINISPAAISAASDIKDDKETTPPFQNFFMVLIPIIIGGIAGFAIYAYFYLKKQKEESKVVKLPLESRIRNLKILKDTGRMEESLSYLFQSIYMELINAKYGRRKNINETIRDFAIISVRDLKLNPASIYPFIQKIEQVIYARPFIIKDKDFYEAVALFSPIYYELTGYTFVLNF